MLGMGVGDAMTEKIYECSICECDLEYDDFLVCANCADKGAGALLLKERNEALSESAKLREALPTKEEWGAYIDLVSELMTAIGRAMEVPGPVKEKCGKLFTEIVNPYVKRFTSIMDSIGDR